ncbi:UDP-2-acetamido-2,6-beta-L-arabino-hexul-4-ose reductase [Photobacterium sp. 53610]|uniref:UDP-2-acetamido-2,6-beta-L-arabino-hexul-4-ose reductase n=1 Tax=Photobacterium sp. 53610 TaxID=3102789 RepID=UPI002EDB9BC5
MKIVVTGAYGFIGKNLCLRLNESGYTNLVLLGSSSTSDDLVSALADADFVFHLAGVNRTEYESEFLKCNTDLTEFIVKELIKNGSKTPLMVSSSMQATNDTPYGLSKKIAEEKVELYGKSTGADYFIYRFPNVFGKWCKPNYNSFIATFCHNIANDIDINIHDPSASVNLIYIDDVCNELISLLSRDKQPGFKTVHPEYQTTVGSVAETIRLFKSSRNSLITEHVGQGLVRALYSTYISYFSPKQFTYTVPSYADERGIFCEMLKTKESGQFSFFTAHPGITRGGHYHHSKNEKFLVLKGMAKFRFEHVITGETYEITTSSEKTEIVETVPGWSHDITNVGGDELVVMLWANEVFDRDVPDTIARPLK